MLNKREMALAQELARELTEVNQQKERFENALETAKTLIDSLKDSFTQAWNFVREVMGVSHEVTERIEHEKALRETWHVPVKINPPPMPDIPMPRMMNIRSDL